VAVAVVAVAVAVLFLLLSVTVAVVAVAVLFLLLSVTVTVTVSVILVALRLTSVVRVAVLVRVAVILVALRLTSVVRVTVLVRVAVAVLAVLAVVRGARHASVHVHVRGCILGRNRGFLVHDDASVGRGVGGDVGTDDVGRRDRAVELQGDRDGGHPAADVHAAHVTGDVGDLHRGSGEGRGHHVDVGGSGGNVDDVLGDGRREGRGQGRLGLLEALGLGVVHLAALGEGDLGVDLQRR